MRFAIALIVTLGLPDGRVFGGVASSPELDGIAHVALRVSNIAVSRSFYEKLGFEQAFEFNDDKGTTTSYLKINDRQFIELYRRGSDADPLGLMHICFDAGDIERLRAAYLEAGLQPPAAVKARAGNLLFSLRDPEGRVIEYTQYLPGSLHWKARGAPTEDRRISGHLVAAAAAANDLAAVRAFFAQKLGFTGDTRLRVPGSSGEEVVLESAAPGWKPKLAFAVSDVLRAAGELRGRGLPVEMNDGAPIVVDPDGVLITFAPTEASPAQELLALERRAMEGWQKGDPDPALAILDPDITYFHSITMERLDGLPAVRKLFESYRGTPLFDSFEIANPKLQVSGDAAILTYRFVSRNGAVASQWNATQVYHRTADGWRVLHTHYSQRRAPLAAPKPSPPEN